jgi:hypothetical protein
MQRPPAAASTRGDLDELALRVAVAAATSEGLAILWVCIRRGFGAPDLPAFALWSLLFGLWMGAWARAFRDVVRRPYGLPRTGAVAALGLAGALVWTMVVTWVFGPWVTALNLPAAWLWACSGIAALVP